MASYNPQWDSGYGFNTSSAPPEEGIELLPVKGADDKLMKEENDAEKGLQSTRDPSAPRLSPSDPPPAYPGRRTQEASTSTFILSSSGILVPSQPEVRLIDREDYPGEIILGAEQLDATAKPEKSPCCKKWWLVVIFLQAGTFVWLGIFSWQHWENLEYEKYKNNNYYTKRTDHFNKKFYHAAIGLLTIFYICMFLENVSSASAEYSEFKHTRKQIFDKVETVRQALPKIVWQAKSYHMVLKTVYQEGEKTLKEEKEVTHMETRTLRFKDIIDASPRFTLGKFSTGDLVKWTFKKSYAFADRESEAEYDRLYDKFVEKNTGLDKQVDITTTFTIEEPFEACNTVYWSDKKPWWSALCSQGVFYVMALLSCSIFYRVFYSWKSKKYTYVFLKVLKL